MGIGTVVAIAGTDDADASCLCQFPEPQRLDRVAAQAGEVVDQEPRHAELVAPLDDRLGEGVAGAAGESAADGCVGQDVVPGDEDAIPPGAVQDIEELLIQ